MKQTLLSLFIAASSLAVNAQNTYVPDDNFEQALIDLGHDSGTLDDYVPTANINTVTVLDISSKNIADLTGIEGFTALTWLNCLNNDLTSIDVSANTNLVTLICRTNQLTSIAANTTLLALNASENNLSAIDLSSYTSLLTLYINNNSLSGLDVSSNVNLKNLECYNTTISELTLTNNTALETLKCHLNGMTSLDLSLNPNLTSINALGNQLTSLNVKNGTNANIPSANFNVSQNPNLTCIQVDSEAWSTTNWTNVDATAAFNEDCNATTFVPDDNFEQALIDLGYDSGALDDYVPTINISSVVGLSVNNKNISDLTGIEGFTALSSFSCSDNSLTSLNLSANVALNTLYCRDNNLTTLDVSSNLALGFLFCQNNALSNLDLSANTGIKWFFCDNNSLTNLDLSNNINVTSLSCSNNSFTSLDLSANTLLNDLTCNNNSLTSLNLSANTALNYLACSQNSMLTSLNVKNGNNTNFSILAATNNPNLTCIQVDDAAWSTTNWTNVDATTTFSEDCASLSVEGYELNTISLYPNPIKTILNIQLEEPIEKVEVFSMQGQKVLGNKDNKIDVSNLSNGVYILKVHTDTGKVGVKRFIKE